jgi:hydrogenase/urease accessory protein HupE
MHVQEFFIRLRIGIALLVGYFSGESLRSISGEHASEFFVLGFSLGVIVVHGFYWVCRQYKYRG